MLTEDVENTNKSMNDYVKDIEDAGNDRDLFNVILEIDASELLDKDRLKDLHQIFKNNRYQLLEDKIDVLKKYLTDNVPDVELDKKEESIMLEGNKLEEAISDYTDKFSVSFMAKIFAKMKDIGWDGKTETAEEYFQKVLDLIEKGKTQEKDVELESKLVEEPVEELADEVEETEVEHEEEAPAEDNIEKEDTEFEETEVDADEDKTLLDYLQDRIGQQLTVGELNSVLQSLFSRYNQVFLLASDLYNMNLDETQEVVIFEDEDMYTVKFDIIDMDEGIIEITDAIVE
jgi:hypothetical protein